MGYQPAGIRRFAQCNRTYTIIDGSLLDGRTSDPDLDPYDSDPLWYSSEGSAIVDDLAEATYVDPENASHAAAARCQTTSRATVQGYKVTATYNNIHEIQSTHPTAWCMTQEFGASLAHRIFAPTSGNFERISGVCRIDTDLLTGIGIQPPPDPSKIAMKITAMATMGIGEPASFIKAEWMLNETPAVWRVTWQYVYFDGQQHVPKAGTYDLAGFAALQKLTDCVYFDYNLSQSDLLEARAYQNADSWDDQWWPNHTFQWGSLFQTIRQGPTGGALKYGLTRQATTEVDEQHVQRQFPIDPRS